MPRTPKPAAKRTPPVLKQVPPEEAKKLMDAAIDILLMTSSGALKELEKY